MTESFLNIMLNKYAFCLVKYCSMFSCERLSNQWLVSPSLFNIKASIFLEYSVKFTYVVRLTK